MPIYTRWEKTKPVPLRVTHEKSLEEQIPDLIATFDEITEMKHNTGTEVDPVFRSSVFNRRPNAEGILNVTTRLAKKIKESLD
jgi:ubiquinol-cytochrome c reductase cytochrome b subunit